MSSQFFDGFGDVAVPGPRGPVGDITPEAESARAEVVRAREDVAADTLAAGASATQAAEALAEMRLVAGSDEVVKAIADAASAKADAASAKAAASTASTDASSALTQLTTQRLAKIVPGKTNPAATVLPEAVPPAGSRFIIQAGSVVPTTNAAGDFSFEWPEAFPTGILSVQLTSGDSDAHLGAIVLRSATTLTTCHASAVGRASAPVRCDYIAIGY